MITLTVISIIIIVLNVVLFFKIWGMCDDVRRLTEHICDKEPVNIDAINAKLAKNDNPVKDDLCSTDVKISTKNNTEEDNIRTGLISDLNRIAEKSQGIDEDTYKRMYHTTPTNDIAEVKNRYVQIYKNLGIPFPEDIAGITTLEDLWEIFN